MTNEDFLQALDITISQPEQGYRYNEDSIMLANFVKKIKNATIVDMGAGCGVISLLLAKKFPDIKVVSVEIDTVLHSFLKKNVEENNLSERVLPVLSDWTRLKKEYNNSVDIVVTNPPFREAASGRVSKIVNKAVARHELIGGLEGLLDTAKTILKDKGIFYAVFLTERLVDLIALMRHKHIEPKEILPVYPYKEKNSSVFLVKGIKNGGKALKLLPPFFRR